MREQVKTVRLILLIALSFFLMNLVGLDRSPVVWFDEVSLNDPAKELARNGLLRSSVFAMEPGEKYSSPPPISILVDSPSPGFFYQDRGFGKAFFWLPPLQQLITAGCYRLFGFGIWQTRIPPLIFGGFAIVLLGLISLRIFGSRLAAVISSLIFALNPKFIQTARAGRMDAQCFFFVFLGLYLYLKFKDDKRNFLIVLSGLMVGLAGVTHPAAVSWAIAIGVLLLLFEAEKRVRSFILFAVFASLPPLLWLSYGFYFYPRLLLEQFFLHGSGRIIRGGPLHRLASEFSNYLAGYKLVPLLIFAYIGAVIWLLIKLKDKKGFSRSLFVLFSLVFFFNAFFMVKKNSYTLYPLSILTLVIGAYLSSFLPAGKSSPRLRKLALIFVVLLFGNIIAGGIGARYLTLAYQWRARDRKIQLETPFKEIVPRGSLIWGRPEVWYAAEKNGSHLRLSGQPEAKRHHFAIVRPGAIEEKLVEKKGGFSKVRELGEPLPPLLGRIKLPSADYRLNIWRSDDLFSKR